MTQTGNLTESNQWVKNNWIALLSLVVATIALVFSFFPENARIDYEVLPGSTYKMNRDTTNVYYTHTVVRLLIKNNGSKKVTIESLVNENKNGIFGYTEKGEQRNVQRSILLQRINEDLLSKFFIPDETDSLSYVDLNQGMMINEILEPGENMQLNFLFIQTRNLDDIETFLFDATLKTSDNNKKPIRFEIDQFKANYSRRPMSY